MSKVRATSYYDKLVLEIKFDGMSQRQKDKFDQIIGDGVVTDREMVELMDIKAPELLMVGDVGRSGFPRRWKRVSLVYPKPHQRAYVWVWMAIAIGVPASAVIVALLILYGG